MKNRARIEHTDKRLCRHGHSDFPSSAQPGGMESRRVPGQALTESALAWFQGRSSLSGQGSAGVIKGTEERGSPHVSPETAPCTDGARAAAGPAGRPGRRSACATDTHYGFGDTRRLELSSALEHAGPAAEQGHHGVSAPARGSQGRAGPRRRARVSAWRAGFRSLSAGEAVRERQGGRRAPARAQAGLTQRTGCLRGGRGPLPRTRFRTYVFCCQSRIFSSEYCHLKLPFPSVEFNSSDEGPETVGVEVPGNPPLGTRASLGRACCSSSPVNF